MDTYGVISGSTMNELVRNVNQVVGGGSNYRPEGGVSVINVDGRTTFYQAVVRKEE